MEQNPSKCNDARVVHDIQMPGELVDGTLYDMLPEVTPEQQAKFDRLSALDEEMKRAGPDFSIHINT
ncbi:MAG TPA: hypothetical protein PKB09_01740 [Candidatus Saccharibacteria bacterium]|nr:hypothetical protein [Candidatus Saccharibacteria bacterium]